MNEAESAKLRASHFARAETHYKSLVGTVRIVGIAVLIALGLRSLVLEPFNIPSASMLPTLLAGDYLFVAKWPYGYSRYSLPFAPPLFDGRIGGTPPERGDIVVFKTPRDNRTDFIKRIVGLPGDRIRMVGGRIELNGAIVPQTPAAAFATACEVPGPCRVPRAIETLGNRRYGVLDVTRGSTRDDTPLITVPAGHYFVEGDNRDDSADSRLTVAEGGVGLLPEENLIGRAELIFFSTTGDGRWSDARSWWNSLRLTRVGARL